MHNLPYGASAADFRWAVGIENTFVPQTRPGLRALDEYELMGHYEHWREDLVLARDTGAQMIRWGIPWYRVEPERGHFDWDWTDQVLPHMVEELGLEPILDLMHYGTPSWLAQSFVDPAYPDAVAAYARAVAERYGHLLRYYTPLNEPVVNAMMCGKRGLWPPYLRSERGLLAVGMALAKGTVKTVHAIKAVDPRAIMVHVEATGLIRAALPELEPLAQEQRLRDYLFLDLVSGRVTPEHPLLGWMLINGVRRNDLHELSDHPIALDIIGLNFYPQWSTRELWIDEQGRLDSRLVEPDGTGFAELIDGFWQRYQAPLMITETSAKLGLMPKQRWLEASVATIKGCRARGVPVLGYTWFPLFTMVDWRYRTGSGPRNEYLIELGLYESQIQADGSLHYKPTPLVDQFRGYTAHPEAVVGDLALADGAD